MKKRYIFLVLCALTAVCLAACAEKTVEPAAPPAPEAAVRTVIVGKTSDELRSEKLTLSEEDAAGICAAIALSESEIGWIDDLYDCSPSCKVFIRDEAESARYQYEYSNSGIFNDIQHHRALKLTAEAIKTVNGILSKYLSLAVD